MATIRKGILGGYKNKVGNYVGYSKKSNDIVQALPKKQRIITNSNMIGMQERISEIGHFVKYFPMSGLELLGYKENEKDKFLRFIIKRNKLFQWVNSSLVGDPVQLINNNLGFLNTARIFQRDGILLVGFRYGNDLYNILGNVSVIVQFGVINTESSEVFYSGGMNNAAKPNSNAVLSNSVSSGEYYAYMIVKGVEANRVYEACIIKVVNQ